MISGTAARTIAGKGLETIRARARDVIQWWLAELGATLPQGVVSRLFSLPRPRLTIAVSNDGQVMGWLSRPSAVVYLEWAASGFGPMVIANSLLTHHLRREEVTLIFACDAEHFFVRDMLVPSAALAALPAILAQDILHRTPFELDQIWHGATPKSADLRTEVTALLHWIIRRDRAATELGRCSLGVNDVDAITVRDTEMAPTIQLRGSVPDERPWSGRAIRYLAAAAVVATLLGIAGILLVEATAATRIENAITELRNVDAALPDGNRAARLYARKAGPGVVDVWAELSGLLPDQTFLTELRIADRSVAVNGFSSNAANLVRLVEQSPLFITAHLTGAITPDANERKDRFSLAFQLRGTFALRDPRGAAITPGAP